MGYLAFFAIAIFFAIILIKQINEYERGVMFTLGKFSGVKKAGWRIVVPIFQSMTKIDMRTKAVDVPDQEVITRDNIPVTVNAVVYYRVNDAEKAMLRVENFYYAVSQLAQTTMRNSVGEYDLDGLLQKRAEIAAGIKTELDAKTDPWGIDIESLELKDVVIPQDLKRTISKAAEAEREKRAVIITSEGDKLAAQNLADAATTLNATPGALHLRTLQTINDLSSDQSNTTIWMVPIEGLEALKGYANVMGGNK